MTSETDHVPELLHVPEPLQTRITTRTGTTSEASASASLLPAPAVSNARTTISPFLLILISIDFTIATAVVALLLIPHYGLGTAVVSALTAGAGFVLTIAWCRGYRRSAITTGTASRHAVLRVAAVLAVVSLAVQGFELVDLPRALLFNALALSVILVITARMVAMTLLRRLRARGSLVRRTLLVGPAESLGHLFDVLDEARPHGLVVVGMCTRASNDDEIQRQPVLGGYDAIPELVSERGVDAVLVSSDAMSATDLRRLGWQLAGLGAELLVLSPLTEVLPQRVHVESIAGTTLLSVSLETPRPTRWAKVVFDRVLGTMLLFAAAPVIAAAAICVRLTSRGPAFFAQTRVGVDGARFTMHKLRSMYEDAEENLAKLRAENDATGVLFKLHDDPRVTPLGDVLRRFSIDELPQLWNVVKGDMSLVGPRPALPREVALFDNDMSQRMRVKPGLTGLWQVSGRSNLSAEQSIRLDLRYADNWSLPMDVAILWRTARAVFGGHGAY